VKARIKQNRWGNWNGYLGNRKVEDFGLDLVKAESWLTGRSELDILREPRQFPWLPPVTSVANWQGGTK